MKFDMGTRTLTTLSDATSSAAGDLSANVYDLFEAAAPLEGVFNGQARTEFDRFKAETDQIAIELETALALVREGIDGQDHAFVTGEQEMADETSTASTSVSFESALFRSNR